jgi:hypothetical protein
MTQEVSNISTLLTNSVHLTNSLVSALLESIDRFELDYLESDIGRFVKLTTLMAKLANDPLGFQRTVRESHIKLLIILKGLAQARQKQDSLALEELIKYELKDNLTQWKIDLIPQIRKTLVR